MIQEMWQHHRGFREEKELRRVGVKKHCNHYFLLCFSGKIKENRQDDRNCLNSSMVHHAARIGIRIQSVKSMPLTTEKLATETVQLQHEERHEH